MDIFSQCSSNFLQKKWTTLQIRYSILSIKNRCIVEEDIQTHTRTLPPWAVVGGQHGAKDMHILKVIDWKELTCRHSEEFGMQAWHAHPHICWDRKGAAWEKSYAHCGGKCREMQLLTSCSHTGFMYSKWSNRHRQILWNIYMKSCSLCADLCWHVAVRLHEHTQGKSLVWVSGAERSDDTVMREKTWGKTAEGEGKERKTHLLLLGLLLHIEISLSVFSRRQSCLFELRRQMRWKVKRKNLWLCVLSRNTAAAIILH